MNKPGAINYQRQPRHRMVRAGMTHSAIAKTPKDREQDKEIKSLKSKVKTLQKQPDLHYKDTFYTTALTIPGSIVSINPLGQGDDFNQRIGEGVRSKYLTVKMRLNRPGNTTADSVRLIIFWDTQFNGVGGSVAGLLDGIIDTATITSQQLAPLNYRCHERYHILLDKNFIFNPDSSAVDDTILFKANFNLRNKNVLFADSGATFASITKNSLQFYIASSNTSITPQLGFRYWFIDP